MKIISARWSNVGNTALEVFTDTCGSIIVYVNEPAGANTWHSVALQWISSNSPSPFFVDPIILRGEKVEMAREQLRALFGAMPAAARAGFYGLNSALKAALDSGDVEAAILIISAVNPPTGLESVKSSAIAILRAI